MQEIEYLEKTEGNINKFCKPIQNKIDQGLIVPTVFSDGNEDVEEIEDDDDDWYVPVIVNKVQVKEEWWESDDDNW